MWVESIVAARVEILAKSDPCALPEVWDCADVSFPGYRSLETVVICDRCGRELEIGDFPFCRRGPEDHGPVYAKTSAFPFDTPHISGKNMTIESMGHLRKVERDYGVVLTAFANNPSNWTDNLKGDLPKYRGNETHK